MVSQPMEVATGLRQGDSLFPILFNLVLERIVKESNLFEGVELGRLKINILSYADDITLLGKNKEMIIQMRKSLIKTTEIVGLKINKEKRSTWWLAGKIGIGYKKKSLKWKNTDLKEWTNLNTYDRLLPKIMT